GRAAVPGRYRVKLKVGQTTAVQTLIVKIDPRVKTPPGGLAQQFVLASQIAGEMDRDFAALKQVQSLREQLKQLKSKTDVANLADPISSLPARPPPFLATS